MFAIHGLPEEIVADNGPQFVTGEMKDFLKANGVRLCLSSPYHPASNAEAERAVRTFKEAMKVIKNEPGTQTEKLARFLLSYRTTPHSATGCPPADVLMGRRLRTRLELLRPDLSARIEQKSRRFDPMVKRSFEVGEPVLARDYRNRRTLWTKGVIQDRLGSVTYRVQVGKLFWKRHIDQLCELAGSKVADIEPKQCKLPEIDLAEPPDAIVSLPKPDLQTQSASFEKPSLPLVSPQLAVPPQDVSDNSVPSVSSFPEENKRRSTRIRARPTENV